MVLLVLRFLEDWSSTLLCVSLHCSNGEPYPQAKSCSAGYLEPKTCSGVGVSTSMTNTLLRTLRLLSLLRFLCAVW